MQAYFGKISEENVKNNFVLIYELLDELLDFGYPQNTDTGVLKTFITQQGIKSTSRGTSCYNQSSNRTNRMATRRHQIQKKRIIFGCIGICKLTDESTRTSISAHVAGKVIMKSY